MLLSHARVDTHPALALPAYEPRIRGAFRYDEAFGA